MLENELRRLKETIAEPKTLRDEAATSMDESVHSREQSVQDEELPTADDIVADLQSTGVFCEPQTLQEVTIPPTVICDLFQEYVHMIQGRACPSEVDLLKIPGFTATIILDFLCCQI